MPLSRALVTGGTGLVGAYIIDRLLQTGWNVRTLARTSSNTQARDGVEIARGDILDRAAFERAANGCDVIFHAAAAISPPGGWEAFRRPNIDGTRSAISAAERTGARLLHVSSVAVYDARYDRRSAKVHEDAPLGPLDESAFYARSKRESEALVLEAHASGRIWATAVRPAVIYGRGDRQFVPRVARILKWGVAPLIGGGRTTLPIVHAANVAQGAVLAATSDVAGGRAFNLTNDFDVTVRDFFRYAGEGLGRRVRLVPIPIVLANIAVQLGVRVLRLAGRGSARVVSKDRVAMLTHDNPFTSQCARRELDWSPIVRPEQGIPDAFRWWAEQRERDRAGPEAGNREKKGATEVAPVNPEG